MLRLLALALLFAATTAVAQSARVIDGDTLELGASERVRLWGIDAVEGDQICQRNGQPWRCGDDATAALEALVAGHEITCSERDIDRYGRTVATCTVGGQDIGGAMVRSGWALDYERYSGGAYADEQLRSRTGTARVCVNSHTVNSGPQQLCKIRIVNCA